MLKVLLQRRGIIRLVVIRHRAHSSYNMKNSEYSDIINLPYSGKKDGLSMYQRAAQFAPFAALTGHDKAIEKTARDNVARYEDDKS